MAFTPVNYGQASPYYNTPLFDGRFLDILVPRSIDRQADDIYAAISPTYHLRPDLLANDLYNNSNLWWVFAMRNPNTLLDPLWDFTAGTHIYLPQKNTLIKSLGG
jgi:hypothetical protein